MGLCGGGGGRTTLRWPWFMRDQGRGCAASPWWGPGWWQAGTTGPYRWEHPASLGSFVLVEIHKIGDVEDAFVFCVHRQSRNPVLVESCDPSELVRCWEGGR